MSNQNLKLYLQILFMLLYFSIFPGAAVPCVMSYFRRENGQFLSQYHFFSFSFMLHKCLGFKVVNLNYYNSISMWLQNVLNINSWPQCMKVGKEVQPLGTKEGGERVADVTRIIT